MPQNAKLHADESQPIPILSAYFTVSISSSPRTNLKSSGREMEREKLSNITKQLRLQNELPLLVFLTTLKCLIVFPPHRIATLSALYVADDVSASRHVSFGGFAGGYVDDVVEEVGFAVLAPEIPTDNILVIAQMSLAVLATIDLMAIQVDIV